MLKNTIDCIEWIKKYFKDTNGKKAVIGISGGKDSTVCAALCVAALGNKNVIGVIMPNGEQSDIDDARKVCSNLHLNTYELNIHPIYYEFDKTLESNGIDIYKNKQAYTNLVPRIRTTMLYSVAQSIDGGRVCNTSNFCEKMIGWGTLWADTIGDFSPLGNLLISDIIEIGLDLGLPKNLVCKIPADGLTGKSDEENFGFTYDELEQVLKLMDEHQKLYSNIDENTQDKSFFEYVKEHNISNAEKIFRMIGKSVFKRELIHIPTFSKDENN